MQSEDYAQSRSQLPPVYQPYPPPPAQAQAQAQTQPNHQHYQQQAQSQAQASSAAASGTSQPPNIRPRLETARSNADRLRVRQPDGKAYNLRVPPQQLLSLGVGVPLFFEFLWFCIVLGTCVTLFYSIPMVVLNIQGSWADIDHGLGGGTWNIRNCSNTSNPVSLVTSSFSPAASNYHLVDSDSTSTNETELEAAYNWFLGHRSLAPGAGYVVIELVMLIMVLKLVVVWRRRISVRATVFAREMLTARHYTVMVSGLERNCTNTEELAQHFAQWGPIAHVSISLDSMRVMHLMQKHKEMSVELGSALAREAAQRNGTSDPVAQSGLLSQILCAFRSLTHRESRQVREELAAIDAKIEELKHRRVFHCTGYAFVTFRSADSALCCLIDHMQKPIWVRFKDWVATSWLFRAYSPAAPSASALASSSSSSAHNEASLASKAPLLTRGSSSSLSGGPYANMHEGLMSPPSSNARTSADRSSAAYALPTANIFGFKPSRFVFRSTLRPKLEAPPEPSDIIWENLHITLFQRLLRNSVTSLLCGIVVLAGFASVTSLLYFELTDDHKSHVDLGGVGSKVINALVVTFVNWVLATVVTALGRWERHHTYSGFQNTALAKLLLAGYVNSGYSILAAYLIVSEWGTHNSRRQFGSIFWYSSSGQLSAALTAIISNAVFNSLIQFVMPVTRMREFLATRTALTQTELDKRMAPREIMFAARYVNAIVNMSVAMLYAFQMPLAPLIAVFAVGLQYWVDKRNLLRIHKRPPRIDHRLSLRALQYIPWCIYFHVVLGGLAFVLGPWCGNGDDLRLILPQLGEISFTWAWIWLMSGIGLLAGIIRYVPWKRFFRWITCSCCGLASGRGGSGDSYANDMTGLSGRTMRRSRASWPSSRDSEPLLQTQPPSVSRAYLVPALSPYESSATEADHATNRGGQGPLLAQDVLADPSVTPSLKQLVSDAVIRPPYEVIVGSLEEEYRPPIAVDDVVLRETRTTLEMYYELLRGKSQTLVQAFSGRTADTVLSSPRRLTVDRIAAAFSPSVAATSSSVNLNTSSISTTSSVSGGSSYINVSSGSGGASLVSHVPSSPHSLTPRHRRSGSISSVSSTVSGVSNVSNIPSQSSSIAAMIAAANGLEDEEQQQDQMLRSTTSWSKGVLPRDESRM
ncbi:hypothetical protein CAOG_05499 [Capsaspora owczarzaki ATCC 30864]|uniref:Uncharacterized protein n=1 Tax=Capsaspora owczarzaki (strain ATCC 30864) TaxID=595528 RepID=A0A0D2WTI0_CAPO3|nr:hypothetical protein CAOG_05499 [Capsaspora owczarzaki ATCC 30864]KJE94963.1 hypothetical protein CAOG_005499 [Capsaspora owczarzaki ATCC 30864]|eukprot:XP_004346172.1 hypothetical protein CAOG_05499 [Capsaspora owczarzaki ATCC 30864]